jgi:4-aminobutyrate aminotransferase / (S)-3-amino-2-methylpropionate transaminase
MKLFITGRPREGYRIFNTWMGEPSKVILLENVIEVIQRDNLLANAQVTGTQHIPIF